MKEFKRDNFSKKLMELCEKQNIFKNENESLVPSNKTGPVPTISKQARIKHNRTKSDLPKHPKRLVERFINKMKEMRNETDRESIIGEIISKQFSKKSLHSLSKINEVGLEYLKKKKTETTNKSNKHLDFFDSTKKTIAENTLVLKSPEQEYEREISGRFCHQWKVLSKAHPKTDLPSNFFHMPLNQKKLTLLSSVNAHLDSIRKCEFVSFQKFFTFSEDCLIKLWSLGKSAKELEKKPILLKTLREHSSPILSSFSNERFLFSGDSSGMLNCFSHNEEGVSLQRTFKTGHEPVWDIDYLEQSRLILTSNTNRVKIWNIDQLNAKKETWKLSSPKKIYGPVRWCNSDFVAHCATTKTLKNYFFFYDLEKDTEKQVIVQKGGSSNFFKIKDNLLFSANEDKKISVYDIRLGKEVKEFIAHSQSVLTFDFDESQNILISAGCDSSLRLWDLKHFRCLHEIPAHRQKYDDSIFDLKILSQQNLVVTTGADSTFKMFNF
jgi:WD40 repeat protein